MKRLTQKGVTLIELMVVLFIISVLTTIAVGVYTQNISRARFAKARAEIQMLETAITQYEVDTGTLPITGNGDQFAPDPVTVTSDPTGNIGSGYLQLALRSSMNGTPANPLSPRWNGPYIDWPINRLGFFRSDAASVDDGVAGDIIRLDSGSPISIGLIMLLDPWGQPYQYITSDRYNDFRAAEYPEDHPFFDTERFYNPTTYQIISGGPNESTGNTFETRGLEEDDITNFFSSEL